MQDRQHDRPDADEEDVVARKAPVEDGDGAAQPRRPGAEQILRPPEPEGEIVEDEEDGERRQELEQLGRPVEAAQHAHLDRGTQQPDPDGRHDEATPEAEPPAHRRGQRPRPVEAEHVERAVGEIDDAGDAKDEREPRRDEEQRRGLGKPVEGLEQERFEGHPPITAAGGTAPGPLPVIEEPPVTI